MPPLKELIREKLVISALGVVGVIFLASIAYYLSESRPPAVSASSAANASTTGDIIATGTVTPIQNPDLSFQTAGQVRYVHAVVGQKVAAGTLLATLDTGILSANYAAAQATLSGLVAGPRNVDVAGKQTSVQDAQSTLTNEYAKVPALLSANAGQAEDAVQGTSQLFSTENSADYRHISFISQNQSAAESAGRDRRAIMDDISSWNSSLAELSLSSSQETLDAAINDTIARLTQVRTFFSDLSSAATNAQPILSSSELASIATGRTTVNNLIVSLNAEKQTLSNEKLAIK